MNDGWREEQKLLLRLAAIDATGFTDEEKIEPGPADPPFELDEEGAEFKEWEMPVNQMGRHLHRPIRSWRRQLSFKTVKDYDDWIARLHALPDAFAQVTTNMAIGMEDAARAAEVSAGKGAGAGEAIGRPEAGGLAAGRAAQEVSGVDFAQRSRSGSRRRCWMR